MCYSMFSKKKLILILIESSFDSWIFESWIWILIILESWILNLLDEAFSNFLLNLSVNSWIRLDSILKSFSWAFCHHLCYHQNILNQSWFIIMKQWSLLLQGTDGKKNEVRSESNQEKEEQIMVKNKELNDQEKEKL